MKIISSAEVADIVRANIPHLAWSLSPDMRLGMREAAAREVSPRAQLVLEQLVTNADIADERRIPICQDTGYVWVWLEIGPDVCVSGDVFSEVNEAVASAYTEHKLRKSLVHNALFDRTNTTDNTPAFCELTTSDSPGARLHIMLKGGGSDNASKLFMLTPSAGKDGVIDAVLSTVKEKAANACPPLIVGVGVGATFDKVASLAKHALMRPIGVPAPLADDAAFEEELKMRINELGIGAGALGGQTTALEVRVQSAPCHIAALPVAVNMGCSAMRRLTVEL